jgi:hypothetical protein
MAAALSSPPDFGETGRWEAAPWPAVWAAPPRSKDPHLTNCQLLRDLDIERNSFCPLIVAEMDGGKLTMRRRLGQTSTAVGAPSGGASALGSAPTAAERLRIPPSGLGLARQASGWHGAGGSVWKQSGNGEKCSGGHQRVLFIGAKARAGVQQQPDPNLQLNLGFGEGIDK